VAVVAEMSRTGLAAELLAGRRRTEELFSVLRHSHLYERPIAERHRVIFYIGHLDAFDYLKICREGLGQRSKEPALDALFEAGIDPDGDHLPSDTAKDWPTLEQIGHYVSQARKAVDEALDTAPEDAVHMVLEHRLMHLETLAYMWHNFDYDAKNRPAAAAMAAESFPPEANSWRDVPAGLALLGKPRDGSFGWDNEYDEHIISVPSFRMQRFKVTNGEYREFVRAGGPVPHFWARRNGRLYFRGMFEEIPLPLDWPVYATQEQASAYAAWIGKSLPTEAQFHRAAFGTSDPPRPYPWGDAEPNHRLGNFDFKRWDPEPVYATPENESAYGIRQLVGNGWEWTQTPFQPFKGFEPSPAYPGYSANFFDGAHYVLKGGSPKTGARLLRRSFRNWFRADYPYVYSTFRCVEN
jgi:gamma-glutamyl hercynylcysteine S-oxide synthase